MGSGCRRTCRVARMKANVASTTPSTQPMMANGYAQRMLQRPNSKRFASGPHILRKSSEFQPKGNAAQATIMQSAEERQKQQEKNQTIDLKYVTNADRSTRIQRGQKQKQKQIERNFPIRLHFASSSKRRNVLKVTAR